MKGAILTSVLCAAIVVVMTGCTSFSANRMFQDSNQGFVMLAGDAEGIRAYNDGLVGHITEARNDPKVKSAYWQSREKETGLKAAIMQMMGRKPAAERRAE